MAMVLLIKLRRMPWLLLLFLIMLAGFGVAMQYSVAGGSMQPWAKAHGVRFLALLPIVFVIAVIPLKIWRLAAWPLYGLGVILLIAVEVFGTMGMGAQRWLSIGGIRIQPSEVMKLALLLAMSLYFHKATKFETRSLLFLLPALLILAIPILLILRQPDLGTALLLACGSIAIFWAAGVHWRWFALAAILASLAVPIAWQYVLHDYQKQRVLTFLDPEVDPLGSGYHITQSKIAIGSGGWEGKGFVQGTQSQLNFLPEKHTDFIFSATAEELGFLGAAGMLLLYWLIIWRISLIAKYCQNQFGRLVAFGVAMMLFLYVMINVGMVMGVFPVVGVPLPMVSYGGTAMLTMLIGIGLVCSVALHQRNTD